MAMASDFNPVAPFDDRPAAARSRTTSLADEKAPSAPASEHTASLPTVDYGTGTGVDVALGLAAATADDAPVGPEESRRMRAKLDRHLVSRRLCRPPPQKRAS
jgi:hypothetical protein